MLNLTVTEMLFRWFYDYLLILRIFAFFDGVVTLKVGVSRKGTRISQLTIPYERMAWLLF